MAQPPAYNRNKDFGADYGDQTDNQAINNELDGAAKSINAIRENLAKIQRDDGGLVNGIVTEDALDPALKEALYDEFSGNVSDAVLEAKQAAVEANTAAIAAEDARDDTQRIADQFGDLDGARAAWEAAVVQANEYAADAGVSAVDAEEQADRAEGEADRAEDAADLVYASSNTVWRGTYVELQAVTDRPVNTPGVVLNDPVAENNGYYWWTGAGWEKTSLQPATAAALQALIDQMNALGFTLMTAPFYGTDGVFYQFALIDEERGSIAFGVSVDGNFIVAGQQMELGDGWTALQKWHVADHEGRVAVSVNSRGDTTLGNLMVESYAATDMPMPFVAKDSSERAFMYADKAGNVYIPTLVLPAVTPDGPTGLKVLSNQHTDYMHLVSYGQSLSRGATSGPTPITTAQPYGNVTFLSGVLGRPPFATDYSGFKPLVEAYLEVTQNEAESPTSTIANGLVAARVAAGADADDWVFVGTAPGQGGQSISALSKGTIRWERMIDQFRAGLLLAAAESKSYSVWGMAWTQGENNYAINPDTGADWTAAEYRELFLKLVLDFGEDAQAVTGQDFQPPVSTYQTCAHRRYGRDHNNVAIGQWLAARDDASVSMACPIYQIPHNTDNLHLTGDSYIQLGKYHQRALAKMVFEREKFIPTWPTAVLWQGKVIDITFHVPEGELVFDNTLVAAAPNMGFDIWSGDAQVSGAISSVSIIGRDRVRIVLASAPPADALLTYARGRVGDPATGGPVTGPRGNLRDTAGDADNYQDSQGNTRYMHNWCVMFEFSFEKGTF